MLLAPAGAASARDALLAGERWASRRVIMESRLQVALLVVLLIHKFVVLWQSRDQWKEKRIRVLTELVLASNARCKSTSNVFLLLWILRATSQRSSVIALHHLLAIPYKRIFLSSAWTPGHTYSCSIEREGMSGVPFIYLETSRLCSLPQRHTHYSNCAHLGKYGKKENSPMCTVTLHFALDVRWAWKWGPITVGWS